MGNEFRQPTDGNGTYFDGNDELLDLSFLRDKLCKKRYLLQYEKGDIIISPGESVEYCYYLDKGYVIVYEICNGKRRIFDAYNSHNLLLGSHVLFDRPCNFFIEARESCSMYYISIEKVRKLIFNDSRFLRALYAQTTRDMLVNQDLLRKSTKYNVSWQVSDFLIVMAGRSSYERNGVTYLSERFTQKQIADMLFIDRVTCFKELHKLEDMKLIDMQSANIGIPDVAALIEYRKSCEEAR